MDSSKIPKILDSMIAAAKAAGEEVLRIYLDDKLILQSEYRQAFENSNLLSDFSYNNDGKNTNSHFFIKN